MTDERKAKTEHIKQPELPPEKAQEILRRVFQACGKEPPADLERFFRKVQ